VVLKPTASAYAMSTTLKRLANGYAETHKGGNKMAKGAVLYTDGTYEEKEFKQLSDMQAAVDGLIEPIGMHDFYGAGVCQGYVNEEGLLQQLPRNAVASTLSFMFGNSPIVVGNMIVLGLTDSHGNDTDIPQDILTFISRVCGNRTKLEAEYV
jgi:hypothetical protein